ncbi:MAG TPA: 1-deoxy-D-xylulose-5-phosphate reductoisomerase [Desulfurivibrionaceae bacterium]|nr:1-deoxy-D-xylulose-5-phosphate reductoisomerase [Desulfurivibrionaceae bacterium]
MRKTIAILGSTGSIGRNVLEVVRQYPGRFKVSGLAAGNNLELLKEQIEEFGPELVSVADPARAAELAGALPPSCRTRIIAGPTGIEEVATLSGVEQVVSAVVGAAGLLPTLAAIRAGKHIALANKETLVMAGELIMSEVARMGITLHPVDSEHSAIAQGLDAGRREDVSRLVLTASGGPFFRRPEKDLATVTAEEALAHPNWSMGRKISIDSATLMNKGLEVIEAHHLFAIPVARIEVLIHPQSIVHSLVEYRDGAMIAHLGIPDMKIPIAYALSFPERLELKLPRLDLAASPSLEFLAPDHQRFPALLLACKACQGGGTLPAALNGANEVAVEAFLAGAISFTAITGIVAETLRRSERREATELPTILAADTEARNLAKALVDSGAVR